MLVIVNVTYLGFETRALNRGLGEYVSGIFQWVQTILWQHEAIDLYGYASYVNYVLTWGSLNSDVLERLMRCYLSFCNKCRLVLNVPKQ